MSMKKKFLALALAGMVAMPVVANATVSYETKEANSTQTINSDLQISGSVRNAQGQAPAGKLQVELPTAMSFTVDQDGNFSAANTFTITNKGTDAIDVKVAQFSETKKNEGITVKARSGFDTSLNARSDVSIVLRNGNKSVDLGQAIPTGSPVELVTGLTGNDSVSIAIDGIAGKNKTADSTKVDTSTTQATLGQAGTSEDFTLRFLVSKHP